MATRRKITAERSDREGTSTPTQQDEADILEEVGAQPDDDGDLVASEESIRELGAVDADSVRENRRLESIVKKKRANQPNVSFNTGDVISTYDTVIKVWAVNTIEISVRRLTGTPIQRVITTRPRSGAELYEALRLLHGPNEEADYEVKFLDSSRKEWRGKGKITMPDARPPAQQGQPIGYQYPYAVPPPGYPPQPPFTQPTPAVSYPPQSPPAPGAPPFVVQAPAGPDMAAMVASFRQMFDMFQALQPQTAPAPIFAPPAPQQPFMPPPPPPGSDMPAMMAWMKQAFDIFQSTSAGPAHAIPSPQPQSPASNPAQAGPTMQPPAGMMWGWIPGFGFALMPAGGGPGPGFGRGPERRPPPYMQERPPYEHHAPPAPAQRERTAAEQFREAMSVVRTAVDAVGEMNTMLPNMQGGAPEVSGGEDDDSPVKVIDTGKGKFVLDKNNGGFRGWESLYANLPDLLKWAGEQREEIQKSNARQQQRPQQLAPGYVEVGPGYQPPAGFVAVPVDLPPPPSNMPPPIQHPQQRTWGAPTVPEEEERQN